MSFDFKNFSINDTHCAMKIGTDGVLLGAWTDVSTARSVLDIGAGSGLVALMLAQRNDKANISAIELDAGACVDCEANFKASPWHERLALQNVSFDEYEPKTPIDVMVSNPPFFTETIHSPSAKRAQARHADSLSPITLIEYAAKHLAPVGTLAMITPCTDADNILYRAEMAHLKLRRYTEVIMRQGEAPTRLLWQFCRNDGHLEKSTLTLRQSTHQWSDEYINLTKDFYIRTPKI